MSTLMTPFTSGLFNQACRPARGGSAERVLRPRVDVHENEQEFRLRVDLPGVKKDDLHVEVERGDLILKASRKQAQESHTPIRVERFSEATFTRTFSLGDDVDADKISASLEDGVLTVTIPKQEKSLPRRIKVQ
ncbi:MAG: Hsp20/alpha crystallin family protein [Gemmatimonadetes bacterium]|nr:Hsp20/alpha crystallin family protein [Gemmatimonadota bacterium]